VKAHLRATFQQTLFAGSLRKYLKMLPDFDDLEAEEKAQSHAETHAHLGAAIHFLLGWPDLRRLAKLVIARVNDLVGNSYETLTAAADALEPDLACAATLLRRAMITDALECSKTKRYPDAAGHLQECQSCAAVVDDFGSFLNHGQFLVTLKQKHGRESGFWEIVKGKGRPKAAKVKRPHCSYPEAGIRLD
jgi:bacterioferritin (cytochrome b1)